jgi:TPR repeat protein
VTYDVVLWKAKRSTSTPDAVIAMQLQEGHACLDVARFPATRFVEALESCLSCAAEEFQFEIEVNKFGAHVGLPFGEQGGKILEALVGVATDQGLKLHDAQATPATDEEVAAFAEWEAAQCLEQDVGEFTHALRGAHAGSAKDMHIVASCYRFGSGVARDLTQAIHWYERAAGVGLSKAWASLAELYREELGDQASLQRGFACLRQGVQLRSASALEMLAEWLQGGIGCEADAAASVEVWRALMEIEPCNAAFALARACETGNGVEQSQAAAIDYYRLARKAGHPGAFKNLRRLGVDA